MILNSLFDVIRGWPREGAIDETFAIHQTSPPTYDVLPAGSVVSVQATDGSVALATTPNRSTTNPIQTWVVVTDSSDFDSQFLGKVTCLRANAEFVLDPSNFNAGVYTPGTLLTFSAGKWQPVTGGASNQIIGEVLQDNTAVNGTITVFYSGGDTASF
jgi:hypothetical protein